MEESSFTDSILLLKSWEVFIKFEYFCHIILLLYQFSKRHNIVKFLKQIDDADEQVFDLKKYQGKL